MVTIDVAAEALSDRLRGRSWFTAVGTGEHEKRPAIFLYVKTIHPEEYRFLAHGWHGFTVVIRKMGTPKPVSIYAAASAG
jgi:hypothetical protein